VSDITCIADAAIAAGLIVRIKGFSGGYIQVAKSTNATTATAHANFGVTQNASSAAGDFVTVRTGYVVTQATAGAAIAAGSLVTTNGSGKVVAAAALDRAIGRMLYGQSDDAATAADETCLIGLGAGIFDVT